MLIIFERKYEKHCSYMYRCPSRPPGTGPCQARADGGQAGTARRASRVVPLRATGLTDGPGTTRNYVPFFVLG